MSTEGGGQAKDLTVPAAPQVLSRKLKRQPKDIIKLDANENPYGPPPEVAQALGSLAWPHVYPDPECRALREKLSEMNDTPTNNILVRFPQLHMLSYGAHGSLALPLPQITSRLWRA